MPFIRGRYHVNPIMGAALEAAETLPNHTGRASRGFVARVHRASAASPAAASPPETHVFSDHRDLVNFLRDELAKD